MSFIKSKMMFKFCILDNQLNGGEGSAIVILSHALKQLQVPPPANPRKPLVQRIKIPSSSEESDGEPSPHSALIPRRDVKVPSDLDTSEAESAGSKPSAVPHSTVPIPLPRRMSLETLLGAFFFPEDSKT